MLYQEFVSTFDKVVKTLKFTDNFKDAVNLMRDLSVLLNTDCNVLCSQQCSELLLQTLSSAIEIFDKSKKHDSSLDQMEMFETTDTSANNTVFQILNSCNDLPITEQGKCFCLCTIAHVAKQNSPLFDKAFGYLCDIKLDVQTLSLDFFIYSQIVEIFSNQLQLPRQCFDWIFGHLQRMCKSHFRNSEASFVILNLLKKLLPSVSALEAGSTKNNVVIMLSSFIIQCWKNNYGPWVSIELMDCMKTLAEVDSSSSWSRMQNGTPLFFRIVQFLKSDFFSIRLEVAKCFSKLFDLQSRQISDHDKYLKLTDELFRDICATLKEDLAVSDSENELVSIDKRETKILTDLHVLAGIGAVNAKYRPRVMLVLLEMKVEKNIDTDILCDTINLIAQQLSITKHQLLQEYMPYILSNWKSDFSQFPKTILDIHSTKDFFQQCQHIMIGPVLSGNTLDAFCTKIGKDKETVAKSNLVQIVTLLLIYQELEDSRIEAVSDVLSVAYDHDGKRLSSEIQNVCDEVVGELVGHVFDTSDYNKSFGKVEALPELQCPVLTREQVVRALDKVYKSKSSFMISICTENPSKLQTLLTSTVQKIYKSLSTQEKLLRFHHYTIFLDLINDELKTNSDLGNMEVYLIRDITHSLINLILNNEDYKIQQVVLKYLSKFTEVVLVEHSSIFGKYLKFVVGTMVSLCETRIEKDCLVYLKMLLVDRYVGLKVFIHHLDPLPTETKFLELCRMLESLKGMPKDKSLRDELDFFIQTTNSKDLKVHVELLRNLRKVLTANKKKMVSILKDLQAMRGFSEDCECSLVHKLICSLLTLICSKDKSVCLEASKCLGELGPVDLTTMILTSESSFTNFKQTLLNIVLKESILLLIDTDIQVVHDTSKVLYCIFKSKEGFEWLKLQKRQGDVEQILEYRPFIQNNLKNMFSSYVLSEDDFKNNVDVADVWTPRDNCDHKGWLTRLTTRILEGFPEESFLRKLIPICKRKLVFTEKIFPAFIKQLIEFQNDDFNKVICDHLREFFKKHFENSSIQTLVNGNGSDNSVYNNKASIQCMLNVVECLRLDQKCDLSLNYLHVAHAAKCNAAYFTAILYCELWFQSINDFGMGPKCLSRPLDCVISENGGRHVQNVLRECYLSLGDTDAVKGCTSNEPTTERLKRCGLWNKLLLHYDTQLALGQNQHMSSLIECLQNTGLFYLSGALSEQYHEELSDAHYESLWRLGEWSVNTNSKKDTGHNFNRLHYGCLKSLMAGSEVEGIINQARMEIVDSLQNISLECCNKFYKDAMRLQMLQEIEDFQKLDAQVLVDKWSEQDCINSKVFDYTEPILAQRAVMLIQKATSNTILSKALVDTLLNLAHLAIRENRIELAQYNLSILQNLSDLPPHARGQSMLLQAQLSPNEDTKFFLEQVLNDDEQRNTFNYCTALKMYGDWSAETRSENAEVIVKNYYEKSAELLEVLGRSSQNFGLVTSRLEVFKTMAQFADAQYKKVQEYIKSSAYEKKIQCMAKSRQMAHTLNDQKRAGIDINQDERMALRIYDQQSKIDKAEIENTEAEREMYLGWAIRYYMQCLQEGSDTEDLLVFRVASLWLENTGPSPDLNITALSSRNTKFIQLVNQGLKNIAAYKFLPVLPQLAPRLADDQDNRTLTELIETCATVHPYHTLPIVMSLAHALQDTDNKTKDDKAQESRIRAARKLIHKLKSKKNLQNLIVDMEKVSLALIRFANYAINPEMLRKSKKFKLPKSEPISRLKNLTNTPVPTLELPVVKNGDYKNITTVVHWDDEFTMVGGINAPKKLICRGSDGVPRPQLLKGKDDLRQDAVMQQVFTIMNDLLRRDKDCGARKLLIRTYKVVPLSQRSGVIEWCANTVPLGAYLIGEDRISGAHTRYRPNDLKPRKAHENMSSIASQPVSVKLQMFMKICENFQPVFQHFFLENFPTPTVWFERRQAYTHSVATSSMVGYILGLGDRHVQNILVDKNTAELIHIDFGIAFEQGRVLPTPETVPFRLTRDVIAGMGVTGIEGVFRSCCEKTMVVLRNNHETILTILEVLLYDPLYAWTVTPRKAYNRQRDRAPEADLTNDNNQVSSAAEVNEMAQRALMRLKQKLLGTEEGVGIGMSSIEGQVARLIHEATDPSNLCRLFVGWQPYL